MTDEQAHWLLFGTDYGFPPPGPGMRLWNRLEPVFKAPFKAFDFCICRLRGSKRHG